MNEEKADANQITFEGTLGKDPELRYTAKSSPVCNFSLCSENKKGFKTWMNVVVWGSLAESVHVGLRKGEKTVVEGYIGNRSWTDKNTGKKTFITEITAKKVELINKAIPLKEQHGNRAENGYMPE